MRPNSIPTRRVSYEEAIRDMYVFEELRKLGYDIDEYNSEAKGYDENKYLRYVSIATECLLNDKPIPEEVVDYMLKVKAINEQMDSVQQ